MSKKLAAGLEHLVLDVKCGNGAVMQDVEKCRRLAEGMVAVGNGAGMKTSALLTDMSVPLAWSAGNALEVHEAVSYLKDPSARHPRLHEVVMALGSALLVQSGVCPDASSASQALLHTLDSGSALSAWAASIEAMGAILVWLTIQRRCCLKPLSSVPSERLGLGCCPVTMSDKWA